jgi:hypothetical protein
MNLKTLPKIKKLQRGQGMTEFAVAASFFIVPLLIGMTWLARVESSRQQLHQAARYAAWERTIWYRSGNTYVVKSDTEIAREISSRIMAPVGNALDTQKDRLAITNNQIKPFLYTPDYSQGNTQAMLKPTGNQQALVRATYAQGSENNAISSALNTVGGVLGLKSEGIVTNTVAMEMQVIPSIANLNVLPNSFISNSRNALLTGSWNARGPKGAEDTVRKTVVVDYIDKIPGFDLLTTMIGFVFPEFDDLDLGHVDANRAPCQRLVGVNSQTKC